MKGAKMLKSFVIILSLLTIVSCGENTNPTPSNTVTVNNPPTTTPPTVLSADVLTVRCYSWVTGVLVYGPVQATNVQVNGLDAIIRLYPGGSTVRARANCIY